MNVCYVLYVCVHGVCVCYVYVCVVCSCSDASSVPTPDLEDCQQSHDSRSEWGEGVHSVCRNASSHMTLAVSGERVYIECVGLPAVT